MRENDIKAGESLQNAEACPTAEKGKVATDDRAAEYELILASRNNDENAFSLLYKRYLPTIFWYVSSFSPPASEKDDLFQEGVIGLLKAIRTYDNTSSAFQTYASLCIKRSIISALRKYNRTSRLVYSAEVPACPAAEETPVSGIAGREDDRQRYLQFIKALSPFEKRTLSLYISGMPYASMAEKLGCPVKSVDNALTRIKLKIKKQKRGNTPE
jgi:RNA polymerase sporulation-specific sigma factor